MDTPDTAAETLIEALYMAGADGRYWPEVLTEARRLFVAQHAAAYVVLAWGEDPLEMTYYQDGPDVADGAGGEEELIDIADARKQAASGASLYGRHRLIHVVVSEAGHRLALVLRRAPNAPAFPGACEGRLKGLSLFMDRALREGGKQRAQGTPAGHLGALNALATGCMMFDEGDRLVFSNTAAEAALAAEIGLQVADGRLRFSDKRAQAAFDAALSTFPRPVPSPQQAPVEIIIRRPSAAAALVLVAPITSQAGNPYRAGSRLKTAVYIVRPAIANLPGTGAQRLCRLYGLTMAEAEITVQLLLGKTAKTISADRGVSLHTVRGQIKQILDKTQSKGQSGLFRLQGFFEA